MNLIIIIPTYQRPSTLYWSLESVVRQRFSQQNFQKRIYIVNNDQATSANVVETVNRVIQNNPHHEFDHIEVIQGNPNLYLIHNWFDNLRKFTALGDIAIIHGDDDIMLPNTLFFRYKAAKESNKLIFVANSMWSCHFIQSRNGIYIDLLKNPYQSGISFEYCDSTPKDLVDLPIPFISAYTYKISDNFWSLFQTVINWCDVLPFEPKIKYPFVPYFIGLAAHHFSYLAVSQEHIVIRGQLFAIRYFLPPKTVTEYANGGITLLTGLVILNNETLKNNPDFEFIRFNHRKSTLQYIFQSVFRRNGLSISDLRLLYQMSFAQFAIKEFTYPVILKNLRHLSDNILFTLNIKKWVAGFGKETSYEIFWTNWDKNNFLQ